MQQEVAVDTVIQSKAQSNDDRTPRWSRTQRAELFDQYLELPAHGLSLRQAAKALAVPRSTLQAWRAYQESLDAHPAVVVFFQSSPGLAFLHRLVLGIHLVCTEVGACGIRLVCLLLKLTGLDRFVAASYGIQQQVNRQVEEAIVRYRREESAQLAQDMPAKAITLAKDETFTGGLCLVAAEPKSNYIVLEQAAHARDQDTWQRLMEKALSGLHCQVMQSTSDEAPGLLAYVAHHLGAHHSPDLFHVQHELVKAVAGPMATKQRAAAKAACEAQERLEQVQGQLQESADAPHKRGPARPPKQPPAWSSSNRTRKQPTKILSASVPSASRSPRAFVTLARPPTLSIWNAACGATVGSLRQISKGRLTPFAAWRSTPVSVRRAWSTSTKPSGWCQKCRPPSSLCRAMCTSKFGNST